MSRVRNLSWAMLLGFAVFLPMKANAAANDFVQGTAASLTAQLIGSSNVTLSGSPTLSGPLSATSTFSSLNAGTLPGGIPLTLGSGIFLSVGTATGNLTGETNTGFGTGGGSPPSSPYFFQGDTDLQTILNNSPYNGAVATDVTSLTFNFTVPAGKTSVSMNFIFASQENPTSNWDVAGVIVDGVNYAFMPNGSILRVAPAANITAYTSPVFPDWQGFTKPQTLVALLNTNLSVHTIKIAVANTDDHDVPTGIFVSSLDAGNATTGGVGNQTSTAAVPTLSQLGEITMALLLALVGGYYTMRRRQV